MRRSYALSPSVTSRVPHGSLDVDARLGFRRTRPRSTLQVLPAQRFVGGTPYLYFQEPRKLLFPGAILAHLPLTMLCPPGADVGESMYPIPEGDGFYSSPTPPRFYNLAGLAQELRGWRLFCSSRSCLSLPVPA